MSRNKKNSFLYFLIWIWGFLTVIESSLWGNDSTVSRTIWKLILCLRIIFVAYYLYVYCKNKIKKRVFLELCIFVLLVVLEYYFSKNWLLFDSFFIALFLCNKLEYRRVLRTYLSSYLLSFFLIVFLSSVGIMPTYNYLGDRTNRLRMSLGFRHATVLGETVMVIVLLVFLLYYEKKKNIVRLTMVLSSVFLYLVPNSLTVSIELIIVLIGREIIDKYYSKCYSQIKNNFVNLASVIICVLCFVVSYTLLLNPSYDGVSLFTNYESLLSRVSMGRTAFLRYGVTPFGTEFSGVGSASIAFYGAKASDYFTIDCLYYNLPIRYGIIGTIAFFAFFYKFLRNSIENYNLSIIVTMITMLFFSLSSGVITLPGFNFMFICQACNIDEGNGDYYE